VTCANGWRIVAQSINDLLPPNSHYPESTSPESASYVFCFGGNPGSVYFSDVIALAPSAQQPNLGIAFGRYLTAAGFRNDGGQCIDAWNRADAEAEMERREGTFGTRKVVHTRWTGGSDGQ
jgi:hypothetical protein